MLQPLPASGAASWHVQPPGDLFRPKLHVFMSLIPVLSLCRLYVPLDDLAQFDISEQDVRVQHDTSLAF